MHGSKIFTLEALDNSFDMGSKGEGRVKDKIYIPSLCHQENESTIHCHSGREMGFTELG